VTDVVHSHCVNGFGNREWQPVVDLCKRFTFRLSSRATIMALSSLNITTHESVSNMLFSCESLSNALADLDSPSLPSCSSIVVENDPIDEDLLVLSAKQTYGNTSSPNNQSLVSMPEDELPAAIPDYEQPKAESMDTIEGSMLDITDRSMTSVCDIVMPSPVGEEHRVTMNLLQKHLREVPMHKPPMQMQPVQLQPPLPQPVASQQQAPSVPSFTQSWQQTQAPPPPPPPPATVSPVVAEMKACSDRLMVLMEKTRTSRQAFLGEADM